MSDPVLVTGGTGTIGTQVVARLRERGRDVRVLTRHPRESSRGVEHVRADLMTGTGVAPALRGVRRVIHASGSPKGHAVATAVLAEAARQAGVEHLTMVSVVGAGRLPVGYFRTMGAAEAALEAGGVPWSTVRAAQLHDFVRPIVSGLCRPPVVLVPRHLRAEPVDADAVASRVVEVALGEPAGLVPDVVGPEVLDLPTMVRQYLDGTGRRRPVLRVGLPGAAGRAYKAGANLAGPDALRVGGTWAEDVARRST